MSLLQVAILAIVQGLTELLPVSSSAHVVVAEKLMGLDPSSPPMTLLLVMLHTGTMFAVIVYFWKQWRRTYFESIAAFKKFAISVALATALTGVIGEAIIKIIERTAFKASPKAEIEDLFSHLELIAPALAIVGILIVIAGVAERRHLASETKDLNLRQASLIGAVQGLCLPFRGFSRSGATVSTALLAGIPKVRAEAFSLALAVVLTPPVVAHQRRAHQRRRRLRVGRIAQSTGRVFCIPCRSSCAPVAKPVARKRSLVSLRRVLWFRRDRDCHFAPGWILRVVPFAQFATGRWSSS